MDVDWGRGWGEGVRAMSDLGSRITVVMQAWESLRMVLSLWLVSKVDRNPWLGVCMRG